MWQIHVIPDSAISAEQKAEIRALLDAAFEGDLSDDDADHAAGGIRVLAYEGARLIGHAAVISRQMQRNNTTETIGYVEGVAVLPASQGRGVGRALMERVAIVSSGMYRVTMLSTGEHAFYEKLGWHRFLGESYVDHHGVHVRTADEDDGLMILVADRTWNMPGCTVVCDWRAGDVW
ncbi:MAG: aminoglycoside N-acetyltransferase AAC(2)-Ie [Chloroflexota bacterium]